MRASGHDRIDLDWYVEPCGLLMPSGTSSLSTVSPGISRARPATSLAQCKRALSCMGSDSADHGFGTTGLSFFDAAQVVDNIITNPPFGLIEPYIKHALSLTRQKVVVLARLALLEGIKRREMFQATPLARVWVSSRRMSTPPGGSSIEAKGGAIPYAWFVWDHSHIGEPTLGWF